MQFSGSFSSKLMVLDCPQQWLTNDAVLIADATVSYGITFGITFVLSSVLWVVSPSFLIQGRQVWMPSMSSLQPFSSVLVLMGILSFKGRSSDKRGGFLSLLSLVSSFLMNSVNLSCFLMNSVKLS